MYSAVAKPDLFDAYLCIGPAIWWDSDLVFQLYRDVSFDPPKRMVITLGSYEEGGSVATSTRRILDRLLEREPDTSLAWFHRGRFNVQLGDEAQAEADFEKALTAELRKDVPSGVYLRLYNERLNDIRKQMGG